MKLSRGRTPDRRLRRSPAATLALCSVCVVCSLATPAGASAAPVTLDGSKLQVFVGPTGGLNAKLKGSSHFAFTPESANGNNAGLAIAFPETPENYAVTQVANRAFGVGPSAIQFHPIPGGLTKSGTGTATNPFVATARFMARTSSAFEGQTTYSSELDIVETVTHVSGTTEFKVTYEVTNLADVPRNISAYVLGELNLGPTGVATAKYVGSPPPRVTSTNATTKASGSVSAYGRSPFDQPFSHYSAGEFYLLDYLVLSANPFSDYIPGSEIEPGNTAIGINWEQHSNSDGLLGSGETFKFGAVWQLSEPIQGSAVTAEPGSGTVTVTRPGTTTPVEIKPGDSLPVGTVVDTTQGSIKLAAAGSTPGSPQVAEFKYGKFKIEQAKGSPLTTLRLTGPLLNCSSTPGLKSASAAGARRGRTLWGSGHGRFRTAGNRGSASIRGTTWQVTDRCDGTTVITSIQGRVAAYDAKLGNRRVARYLNSGQSYYAKPARK